MSMIILYMFLLLFSPFVFAEKSTCLFYPVGVNKVSIGGSDIIISVGKAKSSNIDDLEVRELAQAEAELLAKSYLTNKKIATLNGVYMYDSCTDSGYVYVAVAVDKKSQGISKNMKLHLFESFKITPTLK
jgi:hypothetical protein